MLIGVPKETLAGERRVALAPDTVGRLTKTGVEVVVERGASEAAYFPDDAYTTAGAKVSDAAAALSANVVVKVQKPTPADVKRMASGTTLISLLPVATSADLLQSL